MTLGWGALRAAARAAAAFVASRASFIVHAHRQAWMDAAASRIYRRLPGSGRALVPRMPGPCARCRAGRPPPDGDGEPQPSWTSVRDLPEKSGIYHFLINLSSGMGEWYMKVVYNSFDS